MSSPLSVVLCTAPIDKAPAIARTLVEERLVACVNLLPVQSVYWWEGKVTDDSELLMVMKTNSQRVEALMARIPQIHPYSVPEVVVLAAERVLDKYLAWALAESAPR